MADKDILLTAVKCQQSCQAKYALRIAQGHIKDLDDEIVILKETIKGLTQIQNLNCGVPNEQ